MSIEKSNISSEGQKMCVNCHNFYASEAFKGYCSVCYKQVWFQVRKKKGEKKEETKIEEALIPLEADFSVDIKQENKRQDHVVQPAQKDKKRCYECNKKVGLLGIQCKCGFIYCNGHRLPEDHKCNFDYKSAGKKELEKEIVKVYNGKIGKI